MKRTRIGKFFATTFDEAIYTFIVYEDGIDCPNLGVKKAKRIILNPKFELIGSENEVYSMPMIKEDYKEGLIKKYDIYDVLFKYLKINGMISYSEEMANLYGFDMKTDEEPKKMPYKLGANKQKVLTR